MDYRSVQAPAIEFQLGPLPCSEAVFFALILTCVMLRQSLEDRGQLLRDVIVQHTVALTQP